mmetsp:Transcript_28598/g.63429  ORF Transcript_28598/g.63429 Transcript_28598/m.63429 type:complete len:214 (+) Transcript_28598:126-767(+)
MPATASMARRPFCSSLVRMMACSSGSVGYHPRGSQSRSPGSTSDLSCAARFRPLVSERGSHLLTMVQPSMNAHRSTNNSPNSGNSVSRMSRWRMEGPSMPRGFTSSSWVSMPTAASMHTRPCFSSASLYFLRVTSSLPSARPSGSKKPVGKMSPTSPVGFLGKTEDICRLDERTPTRPTFANAAAHAMADKKIAALIILENESCCGRNEAAVD